MISLVLVASSAVYVKTISFGKDVHIELHSQCVFLFGFMLYIQSYIITLTSEYHFLSQKSLFTDIN